MAARPRHPQSATLDPLPKPFVQSMRVLFDILDENLSGSVKFVEIERRWGRDQNSNSGLPKGILECLRNVTNSTGDLTFDRFCAGLKICLLKNESGKCEEGNTNNRQSSSFPVPVVKSGPSADPLPPPKPPRLNPELSLLATQPHQEMTSSSKRREPRRHTLQNGIDYNRLKRLKQLEQEKTLLKETLLTFNETESWLNKKLHSVLDQIRHVGRSSAPLESSPNHQERLDMKRAQTAEVQRTLVRLVNNWSSLDKNEFLFELNLETQWSSQEKMQRLRQDNHRLLDELGQKQDTIARLEAEKMHLVRQLKRF